MKPNEFLALPSRFRNLAALGVHVCYARGFPSKAAIEFEAVAEPIARNVVLIASPCPRDGVGQALGRP